MMVIAALWLFLLSKEDLSINDGVFVVATATAAASIERGLANDGDSGAVVDENDEDAARGLTKDGVAVASLFCCDRGLLNTEEELTTACSGALRGLNCNT